MMDYAWKLHRDTIILDERWQEIINTRIINGTITRGGTLLLVAREVRVKKDFSFKLYDCNLIIVSDLFVGHNGVIEIQMTEGAFPGDPGKQGASLTVLTRRYGGARVILRGGNGREGAQGTRGQNGTPGPWIEHDLAEEQYRDIGFGIPSQFYSYYELGGPQEQAKLSAGGDGEPGGTGGRGGDGGKGGSFELHYVSSEWRNPFRRGVGLAHREPEELFIEPSVEVQGGSPGIGGPGGEGGDPGPGGKTHVIYYEQLPDGRYTYEEIVQGNEGLPGAEGREGDPGSQGPTGESKITKVTDSQFYKAARRYTSEWAQYRLQMGLYFFRSQYNHSKENFSLKALEEFEAVMKLDIEAVRRDLPGSHDAAIGTGDSFSIFKPNPKLGVIGRQAEFYKAQLVNMHTALGDPRYLDVQPEFARYEDVYTKYIGLVNATFQSAGTILIGNMTLEEMSNSIKREVKNLEGLIEILETEVDAAKLHLKAMQEHAQFADKRLEDIQKEIKAKKTELDNATVDYAGAILGTVTLVASVIAAIPSGGASLIAMVPAIAALGKFVTDENVQAIVSEIGKKKEDQKVLSEMEKQAGGLKELMTKSGSAATTLISFPKALEELWKVHLDNEGYRKLLTRSLELVHEALLGQLQTSQAVLLLEACEKRLVLAKANRDAAAAQEARIDQGVQENKETALSFIRIGQHYMDLLSKYIFMAARAVEIYTYDDMTQEINFSYGRIHPDDEQDFIENYITASHALSLYQNAWTGLLSIINYRTRYDSYFNGNIVHDMHHLSFTDEAVAKFKADRTLDFMVRFADLPSSRYESKAESIWVAFIGATAKSNTITALVEYSGIYDVLLREGIQINVVLQPHVDAVLCKLQPLSSTVGTGSGLYYPNFWGRGIAAAWHVRIEDDEMAANNINLDNLTEVQVWIGYQSFYLAPTMVLIPQGDEREGNSELALASHEKVMPLPPDGTYVRADKDMYLIYRGAKYHVPKDKRPVERIRAIHVSEKVLSRLPYGGSENAIKWDTAQFHLKRSGTRRITGLGKLKEKERE